MVRRNFFINAVSAIAVLCVPWSGKSVRESAKSGLHFGPVFLGDTYAYNPRTYSRLDAVKKLNAKYPDITDEHRALFLEGWDAGEEYVSEATDTKNHMRSQRGERFE